MAASEIRSVVSGIRAIEGNVARIALGSGESLDDIARATASKLGETTFVRDADEGLRGFGAATGGPSAPPKSVTKRIFGIFKAKSSEAVRAAERKNSGTLVRHQYDQLLQQQEQLKNALVKLKAAVNKMQGQVTTSQNELERAENAVQQAVKMKNREAFRLAMPRTKELELELQQSQSELKQMKDAADKVAVEFRDNEFKLAQMGRTIDRKLALKDAAESVVTVKEAAAGVGSKANNIKYYLDMVDEVTLDANARASAIDGAIEEGTLSSVLGSSPEERILRQQWTDTESLDKMFDEVAGISAADDATAGAAMLDDEVHAIDEVAREITA